MKITMSQTVEDSNDWPSEPEFVDPQRHPYMRSWSDRGNHIARVDYFVEGATYDVDTGQGNRLIAMEFAKKAR